jgi:hypothetical protein
VQIFLVVFLVKCRVAFELLGLVFFLLEMEDQEYSEEGNEHPAEDEVDKTKQRH